MRLADRGPTRGDGPEGAGIANCIVNAGSAVHVHCRRPPSPVGVIMFHHLFSCPPLSGIQARIADLEARAAWLREREDGQIERETPPIHEQVERIRRDVEELALFARTTATILIERGICTDQEFADRMLAIDRADGIEDGQITPQ